MDSSTTPLLSTQEASSAPSPVDLKLAKFCVYVPILILSVTGNTLVILSVILFPKMQIVPNLFIANLAACDLTTTLLSIPFDLAEAQLGYFPYGPVICSMLWPLATFSTNSTALTLIAISCDRYLKIIHPMNFDARITKGKCLKIIAFVHLVSFSAVVPYAVFLRYKADPVPICEEDWPQQAPYSKIYTFVLFVLQYVAPLLIMAVIYIRIGKFLFKNTREASQLNACESTTRAVSIRKRKEQNEKMTKMFLIVVVIFLVFMLPHQMLFLFKDYADSKVLRDHGDLVSLISRAFTYTNAVLNALIYGVCNRNFRWAFSDIIKCHCSKTYQRERERAVSRLSSPSHLSSRTLTFSEAQQARGRVDSTTLLNGENRAVPRETNMQTSKNKKPDVSLLEGKISADGEGKNIPANVRPTPKTSNAEYALWLHETEMLLKRQCQELALECSLKEQNQDPSATLRETLL